MLSPLYTKQGNKTRVWCVGWDSDAKVTKRYGLLGGKIQAKTETISGKNIGKKNETTPVQQAELVAKSLWKKQKDKGYYEEGETNDTFLPMLAHPFDKYKHTLPEIIACQPKIDGIRMIAKLDGEGQVLLTSRTGKKVDGFERTRAKLSKVLVPGLTLDGEMYSDKITFETICSRFKRGDETDLEYHVFDCHREEDENMSFTKRLASIPKGVKKVTTQMVVIGKIKLVYDSMMKKGWEGLIIRDPESKYAIGKRNKSLLKLKEMVTEEYKIVGHKIDKEGYVVWSCLAGDVEFSVKPSGTKKVTEAPEQHYNKMLTVQFQNLSDYGVPRFPIGIAVRDYE